MTDAPPETGPDGLPLPGPIVLGSRSPRRRELLAQLVGEHRIVVRPPRESEEAGFDNLRDSDAIEQRLLEITRAKSADVLAQTDEPDGVVLTADTVILGEIGGAAPGAGLVALGQPPEAADWREVVRGWFRDYLVDRTHTAATAVRLARSDGRAAETVVRTRVTFGPADESLVEWYIGTGESVGKAGGYALQGAGSLFVSRIDGSPSNVIGLPLRETRDLLRLAARWVD